MGNLLSAPIGAGPIAIALAVVLMGVVIEIHKLNRCAYAIHNQVVINRKRPNLVGWNLKDDAPLITGKWEKKDPNFRILPKPDGRSQADVSIFGF